MINIRNKSHAVAAEIDVPGSGAEGVIVAQGSREGGWSLYAEDGRLKYFYNFLGILHFVVETTSALPSGTSQVRMEFTYDGGGIGKGATVSLFVDGNAVGVGRIRRTNSLPFSMDETLKVGCDRHAAIVPQYAHRENTFSGKVNWVQITVAAPTDESRALEEEQRSRTSELHLEMS